MSRGIGCRCFCGCAVRSACIRIQPGSSVCCRYGCKKGKKKKLTTQRNHFFLCNVMVQTGARSLDEIEEPVN